MNSSVRWAGLAFAMLVAAPSFAQGTVDTTRTKTGSAPGRAGIGGLIGGSYFYVDGDYSQGALPRFSFDGHFRYQFTPSFRAQAAVGYTWSAYSKHEPPPYYNPDAPDDLTKFMSEPIVSGLGSEGLPGNVPSRLALIVRTLQPNSDRRIGVVRADTPFPGSTTTFNRLDRMVLTSTCFVIE